jgi:ribosomal protein S18 acetylase RimI-like enzyme
VSIRPATEDDHDVLRELWQGLHGELGVPDWWGETWDEAWADLRRAMDGDSLVLLAEQDDEPVGFAVATHRRPKVVYLHDLYVAPHARRRGIAKNLIAGVVSHANASGAEVMLLSVDSDNTDARTVYRRLGFSERSVGLIAALETLGPRLASSGSAPSFASTHVQTDDAHAVERALAQFLPRLGRSGWSEVLPARNGWVTVTDELSDRDRSAQRRLGTELSERLGVPVVAFAVEEETVVRFLMFERGRMVDEYLSVPTYYGQLSKADELSLAANATLVARLTGADPARVRAVARVASSPADLPPARELLAEIAAVMNLEARIER